MLTTEALKAATRRLVKACGGQESCALIAGIGTVRHQHFSEVGAPDRPTEFLRLDRVMLMEADCGQPIITDVLARATNHRLVPLPLIASTRTPLGRVTAQAMKETADVFVRLGGFLDDGVLNATEGAQLDREIDEAILKLLALKAEAGALVERGGRE